jgi:polyribonucleotide nucleotidyltransferase
VETLEKALEQAREARLYVLKKMRETIAEPRAELSPYAPRVIAFEVPVEKIREVIGPGGKVIHRIITEHDVELDIEDDGRVFITAKDLASAEAAKKMVEQIIREAQPGEQFEGTVTRTTSFGAFVEYLPGKEGLIHISKLSDRRVDRVEDVLNVGDKIRVEVMEIDKLGRVNLRGLDLKAPEESVVAGAPREEGKHKGFKDNRPQPRHSPGSQGRQSSPRNRGKGEGNRFRQDRKNW